MLTKEIVYKIIEAGIAAPSGDNLQPWRFRWDGENHIDIDIDIDIDKSLYNIFYREQKLASLITTGATIENMRVCANLLGYNLQVIYFPAPEKKKACVATIALNKSAVDQNSHPLYPYISKRSVNRKVYSDKKIDSQIREKIVEQIKDYEGIKLYWCEDRENLKELARLVRQGDKIMFENKGLLLPLIESIRWTKDEAEQTRDGMSIKSLELGRVKSKSFRLFSFWGLVKVLNHFGLSSFAAQHSLKLMKSSPAVCLLSAIWRDNPKDYIQGGEALERLWLSFTSFGVSLQPMAGIAFLIARLKLVNGEGFSTVHKEQIASLQETLYSVFALKAQDLPMMLFRIGYAPSPSCRSLRKSVESLSNLK